MEELLEVVDVAGHAGHHDPSLLIGIEVEAEALEVGEDPDAKVVHHLRRQSTRRSYLASLGERPDDHRDEVGARGSCHDWEREVSGGHALVDGHRHERRTELSGDGDGDDQEGGPAHQPGVLEEQAAEREATALVVGRRHREGEV